MKQLLFLLLFPCLAMAQYPGNAGQKITLGEQTTADGLVYRGLAADTTRKPSVDTMAYILLDTNTNIIWQYKKAVDNAWTRVGGSISSGVTGVLPVANGGTNTNTLALNKVMVGNGTSGVLTPTNLHWDNTNSRLGINRIPGIYALDIIGNLRITGLLITTESITLGNGLSQTGFIINSSGATNQGPLIRLIKAGVTKGYIGVSSGVIGGTSDDLSSYSVNSITFHTKNQESTKMILDTIGRLGIGQTTPTAVLHLKAGTATAAPIRLTSSGATLLSSLESGAIEFNGTNLLFTPSTTRHTVNHGLTGSATLDFASTNAQNSRDMTISVTGAADGDVVSLGVPSAAVNANTSYSAWVSAANTVTVRFNNYSSGTVDPASGFFKVFVTK